MFFIRLILVSVCLWCAASIDLGLRCSSASAVGDTFSLNSYSAQASGSNEAGAHSELTLDMHFNQDDTYPFSRDYDDTPADFEMKLPEGASLNLQAVEPCKTDLVRDVRG